MCKCGTAPAYHVEQYAVACGITLYVGVGTPVLATQTPGVANLLCLGRCPVGSTVVFEVKTDEVNPHLGIHLPDQACHFEHHCHSRCSVVGSHHGLAALCLVGVVVRPWPAVVVGTEDDALRLFGFVGGNDVAALQVVSIPCSDNGTLVRHLHAVCGEFPLYVVGTACSGLGVGHTGSETALFLNEAECAVGAEAYLADARGVDGGGIVGRRLLTLAGGEDGKEDAEGWKDKGDMFQRCAADCLFHFFPIFFSLFSYTYVYYFLSTYVYYGHGLPLHLYGM